MSSYRRGKFTFGDYPTAGGSVTSAYHSGLVTSSAASLTRTNYSNPITSSLVNGSTAPTLHTSGISSRSNNISRYTSQSQHTGYSASKLTSTLAASSSRPSTSIATSSSTFTTRSPRLQSYLNARDERSKGPSSYTHNTTSALAPPGSRSSRYDLESSRSRSYSHSGLYDQTSYRSRSASVRETSPYDQERDRDLVLSMRSQSAMSSRANSASRRALEVPTYTSTASAGIMDDPMISTYSRSMTSDPLMTSSILGGCLGGPASHSLGGPASLREPASLGGPNSVRDTASAMAALSSSPPKNYGIGSGLRGSDEWSDATWLNNLRISAGMDPIPMPSSTSVQASKAYEAVSTLPRMIRSSDPRDTLIRSNSSSDLRADIEAAVAAGVATAAPSLRGGSANKNNNPVGRARHQTLAYGVSANDLNIRNSAEILPVAGFTSTLLRNGSDNDILVARVPSREGEVYDVRGFESDMSAAIMHAQSRRHSMDNEIIELHPPLVTFASIDYDDVRDPNQGPAQNPPPPAPYDHKSAGGSQSNLNHGQSNPNLVVVNRNDLESILVSKEARGATNAAHAAQVQAAQVQAAQQQAAHAAAQAAHISAQNYHKQPTQPMGSRQHGQYHRIAENANAAAQASQSTTDNAPNTASSGAANKNNNASSENSKVASNHVGGGTDRRPSPTADRSQNGEIDYRKLWEQAQLDNSRLRDDLARTRDELSAAKKKLETMVQTPSTTSGLTDTEKKEKLALEKKLSEMEEELKLLALSENLTDQQLEHLKNDNQRLRDENGALIRVISKLSK